MHSKNCFHVKFFQVRRERVYFSFFHTLNIFRQIVTNIQMLFKLEMFCYVMFYFPSPEYHGTFSFSLEAQLINAYLDGLKTISHILHY